MKKLSVLIVCATVMASCDGLSGGSKDQLKVENVPLLMELTQRKFVRGPGRERVRRYVYLRLAAV